MTRIFFDIETGPLPASQLAAVMPEFHAPRTWNDPAKIAASIAEKREAWAEGAALSAMTGQVLAAGLLSTARHRGDDYLALSIGPAYDEQELLKAFWHVWETRLMDEYEFVGWCSSTFDLPFLVQRSWLLGIKLPPGLRSGRYWSDRFIDLALHWGFGERFAKQGPRGQRSLDLVARAFDIGRKLHNSATFAELFATNREEALAHMETDVRLTAQLWERMRI